MRTIKRIALFLAVVCSTQMSAQDELAIAFRDSIKSDILEEQRYLWISLPTGYDENLEYPVIFLLDGLSNFRATVGVVDQLAGMHAPDMIIVAIPNTDRDRDMTPYAPVAESPFTDMMPIPDNAGQGQNFVSFLTEELAPYVDEKYATAPFRIVVGHSMSGLLALYAGIFHNEDFSGCIAVDPSIWWAKGKMIDEIKEGLEFTNDRIFIGQANTLSRGSSIDSILDDANPMNLHPKRIARLCDKLAHYNDDELYFGSKYYPDETHGSAPLLTTYDGLRFIFKDYPSMEPEFTELMENPIAVVENIQTMYDSASETYGFNVAPEERMINFMGYEMVRMQNLEAAEAFFKLNVHFYPKSQNVYDSLGDCYVEMGKKENAMEYYRKALEIEERPHTKEKLDKLMAE